MSTVGMFVKGLEVKLLNKQIDVAVHSLKDMPTNPTPGLKIMAISALGDRSDAVVLSSDLEGVTSLSDLKEGSIVGTSSLRRIGTLTTNYPHLKT